MAVGIQLVSTHELAASLGYQGPSNAFYDFCRRMEILPVRRGWYDPKLVRTRLDAVQGIESPSGMGSADVPASLVAQRRARLAQR